MIFFVYIGGIPTVSFVFSNDFEERNRDETAGVRDERIAGLVPVGIVLPADHVEEITLAEGQFLRVWFGRIVVEGFDHLEGRFAVSAIGVVVFGGRRGRIFSGDRTSHREPSGRRWRGTGEGEYGVNGRETERAR